MLLKSQANRQPDDQRQLLTYLPRSELTHHTTDARGPAPDGTSRQGELVAPLPATTQNQAGVVISKIEVILEAMVDCIIKEKKELTIHLKRRGQPSLEDSGSAMKGNRRLRRSKIGKISFPSKNPQEAWKFSMLKIQAQLSAYRSQLCCFEYLSCPMRL